MARRNNIEMVHELMEFSKSGPISQIMVMEAIRFYTQMIIDNGEPEDNPETIINPRAWYNAAIVMQEELKGMQEENNKPTPTYNY